MRSAALIAARELRSLFLSPLAWTMLAVVQALAAWLLLVRLDIFTRLEPQFAAYQDVPGVTVLVVAPLFKTMAMVLLLVAPLVTMHLLAEERRSGTLALLLSSPASSRAIVAGKFAGALAFLLCMLALITLLPLWLYAGTPLDGGLLCACVIGLGLLLAGFAAAGLYFSSLTTQAPVAAASTVGTLLLLWLFDWAASGRDTAGASLLAWLSPVEHLDALLRGLVDTADIAYFVLFATTFLALSVRRLDAIRLQE